MPSNKIAVDVDVYHLVPINATVEYVHRRLITAPLVTSTQNLISGNEGNIFKFQYSTFCIKAVIFEMMLRVNNFKCENIHTYCTKNVYTKARRIYSSYNDFIKRDAFVLRKLTRKMTFEQHTNIRDTPKFLLSILIHRIL